MVTEVAKCGKRLNKSIRSVADVGRRTSPDYPDPSEALGFALIDLFIAIFILQSPHDQQEMKQ
jgi:hypothetical protein